MRQAVPSRSDCLKFGPPTSPSGVVDSQQFGKNLCQLFLDRFTRQLFGSFSLKLQLVAYCFVGKHFQCSNPRVHCHYGVFHEVHALCFGQAVVVRLYRTGKTPFGCRCSLSIGYAGIEMKGLEVWAMQSVPPKVSDAFVQYVVCEEIDAVSAQVFSEVWIFAGHVYRVLQAGCHLCHPRTRIKPLPCCLLRCERCSV